MKRFDPKDWSRVALGLAVCGCAFAPRMSTHVAAAPALSKANDKPLEGDRRILHVLNRLGFGPRLGDVEQVRKIGVQSWIDAQLEPQSIDDSIVESKLANLKTLRFSSGQLLRVYESDRLFRRENKMRKRGDNIQNGKKTKADAAEDAVAKNRLQLKPEQKRLLQQARQNGWEQGISVQVVGEMATARLLRASESNRQLQEVLVDFWSNHFNLDVRKGPVRTLRLADERDAIRPHVWGSFRELLGASAKSPAMLWYLDNVRSTVAQNVPNGAIANRKKGNRLNRRFNRNAKSSARADAQKGTAQTPMMTDAAGMSTQGADATMTMGENATNTNAEDAAQAVMKRARGGINENYARELMELHTLGVDGGYTQKDVQEVARCLSGWGIDRATGAFQFRARAHDDGAKVVLGRVIPANGGIRDGETVLDILANHPATARHIAFKLCRRLVSDEPPTALVESAAQVFLKTKGDLKSMVRSIVSSREFNSEAAFRAKIKSPFEFAVSALRAVGGTLQIGDASRTQGRLLLIASGTPSTNANGGMGGGRRKLKPLAREIADMGQALFAYQAPTGWPEDSRTWVSSGALIARLNFALHLTGGEVSDARLQIPALLKGLSGDDHQAVLQRLTDVLLGGEISPATRATLTKQMASPVTSSPTLLNRSSKESAPSPQSAQAVQTPPDAARLSALLLGSPEFQRR